MRCAHIRFPLALLFTAALLGALAGCGEDTTERAKDLGRSLGEKAGQAWNKVRDFSIERKDEAVELFTDGKDKLAVQFERAKAKSADWSEDAKRALDDKWGKVQQAYDKVKGASADTWASARDAFVSAYEAFKAELAQHD